jgi:hypothetical protein
MNCVEPVHRDRLCRWIETHHADGVGIEYQNPKNLSSESLLPPDLAQAAIADATLSELAGAPPILQRGSSHSVTFSYLFLGCNVEFFELSLNPEGSRFSFCVTAIYCIHLSLSCAHTILLMSVVIRPGATQFTRMLSRAHSAAKLRVSWFMPPASMEAALNTFAWTITLLRKKNKNMKKICV